MDFLTKSDAHRRVLYSSLKLKGFIPPEGSEVIVKQIPPTASEYDVLKFCQKVGPVFQVRLMVESAELNRGYAFVTFINKECATKAVKVLGRVPYCENHYVRVEVSLNNCRIFVGGIPLHKSKDEVWRELIKSGAKNVVDVIMFRSYAERAVNRGFVFVEFQNHEAAAHFRAKFANVKLFGQNAVIDWSVPIPPVVEEVMSKVTKLFLRNLDVLQTHEELSNIIRRFVVNSSLVMKVYKYKNYAFVHLGDRKTAEELMESLLNYYKNTPVEVMWAKPSQKMTSPTYRQQIIYRRNIGKKENSVSSSPRFSESSSYDSASSSMSSLSPSVQDCGGSQHFSVFDSSYLTSTAKSLKAVTQNPFEEVPILTQPLVPFEEINTKFSDERVMALIDELSDGPLKQWAIETLYSK